MANLNPEGAFGSLKDRVTEAITQQFPYEGRKHRLELVSIEIKDAAANQSSPHHIDNIQSQYDAKTRGRSWAVPIRASLRLVEIFFFDGGGQIQFKRDLPEKIQANARTDRHPVFRKTDLPG